MADDDSTPTDVIVERHDGSRELHWNAAPRWLAEERAECLSAAMSAIGATGVPMALMTSLAYRPSMRYVAVDHDHEHEWVFSADGSEVCATCGVWRIPEKRDPFMMLWTKAAGAVAALKGEATP